MLILKTKNEELNKITLILFSYELIYILIPSILCFEEDSKYEIFSMNNPIGIMVFFGSQILGILFYIFFKNEQPNSNFFITLISGICIGSFHAAYYIFLYEYPQPCRGVNFVVSIILYVILFKNVNLMRTCLSLILIIIFTLINFIIFFDEKYVYYLYFKNYNSTKNLIKSENDLKMISYIFITISFSICLAGQFIGEKFLIEKKNINFYLLMFFEGIGSLSTSLIFYIIKNSKLKGEENKIFSKVDKDNCFLIFVFSIIYFIYNLNRFYLSKYSTLCQNIFIYELGKFFYLFVFDSETKLGYYFSTLAIFLGMAIFNDIFVIPAFDKKNEENNSPTQLIEKKQENNNNLIDNNNIIMQEENKKEN